MTTAATAIPGHRMLAEIAEQPLRVREAFAGVREVLPALAPLVGGSRQVLLLGRGSSRSASTFAAEAFRAFVGLPAFSISPAQLAWSPSRHSLAGSLAIAVSQSGESTEILAAARQVLHRGGDVVVVTNSPHSTLATLVPPERTLLFHAGAEVAVPATKSFTTSLACLLGLALAGDPDLLREAQAAIPDLMAEVLADPAARFDVSAADSIVCAGEGFAESVGEEGAIKFRETLRLPVASFETSEFLHGSINSVVRSTVVVAIAADDLSEHLSDQAVEGAAERGACTVSIGSSATSPAGQHVRLPVVAPQWTPFLAVLPIQRAAHDAALARGQDPDTPEGLTKVTRIEELSPL